MRKIILDTNFLLIPVQFHVDIFEELKRAMDEPYTLFVLKGTIEELKRIKGKDRAAANVALELIKAQNINIIGNLRNNTVDDELLLLSREGYIVATQDALLRKRIGKGTIVLRQKKYIKVL